MLIALSCCLDCMSAMSEFEESWVPMLEINDCFILSAGGAVWLQALREHRGGVDTLHSRHQVRSIRSPSHVWPREGPGFKLDTGQYYGMDKIILPDPMIKLYSTVYQSSLLYHVSGPLYAIMSGKSYHDTTIHNLRMVSPSHPHIVSI